LPPIRAASAARYGTVAIVLHWLLAAMIVGSLGVGLYMTGLPFSPQRIKLYNWHKWAGVTILLLSALRLLWRLANRPPGAGAGAGRHAALAVRGLAKPATR
jgi:cytochrome b561